MKNKGGKVRLSEIAEASNLSLATVDRVINRRGSTSARAIEKVRLAVRELGFSQLPQHLVTESDNVIRILMVLPESGNCFFRKLISETMHSRNMVRGMRVEICIRNFAPGCSDSFLSMLQEATVGDGKARYDVVALFGMNVPQVKATINDLVDAGTKVVTLVSDIPDSKRHYFIGIDNYQAGRTAAQLFSRFATIDHGAVVVLSGFVWLKDQEDRIKGFRSYMEEYCQQYSILMTDYCSGMNQQARAVTAKYLETRSDLSGIYVVGGGSDGLIEALEHSPEAGNLCVITHDLTQKTASALKGYLVDAVVDQNPTRIAQSLIRVSCHLVEGSPIILSQEDIDIGIFIAENAI